MGKIICRHLKSLLIQYFACLPLYVIKRISHVFSLIMFLTGQFLINKSIYWLQVWISYLQHTQMRNRNACLARGVFLTKILFLHLFAEN